jgi:hypothetical protein
MNNVLVIVMVAIAVVVGGIVTFVAINANLKNPPSLPACQPTNAPVPAAPGPIESLALVNWHDGLVTPKISHVKGPEIFLIINNLGHKKHNFLLVSVEANCKETVLRSMEDIMNSETRNIRIRLQPGHYIIYCDLRDGRESHRALGEVMTVIVH